MDFYSSLFCRQFHQKIRYEFVKKLSDQNVETWNLYAGWGHLNTSGVHSKRNQRNTKKWLFFEAKQDS